MNSSEPQVDWAYFGICIGLVILYNAVVLYMLAYLKRTHPAAWVRIGSPSFLNNSIKNNFLFLGFLFGGKYLLLRDEKLNRLCLAIWGLFGICIVMFLGWFPFGLR